MTPEHAAMLLIVCAIVLYAIFGGADFGGGVWDLLATGPRREAQREAIGLAMGPVWETNHVWLIFALVALFTCFPPVFAKLSIALYFPLTFALVGIIARGAAFAFRGPSTRDLWIHRAWGQVFGAASILTPFFFGAAAAGVATGTFDWLRPFSWCVGLLAVSLCAQLAATFLCAETRAADLENDFRLRAVAATFAVATFGLIALLAAAKYAPAIFKGLVHAWPAVALAMLAGLVVLTLLWRRRFHSARVAVAIEAAAIFTGWYVAQAPVLRVDLGLQTLAASPATIVTFLWIALVGSAVLIPSLLLLFTIFKRDVSFPPDPLRDARDADENVGTI